MRNKVAFFTTALVALAGTAQASVFTTTDPSGYVLPSTISPVGGIVLSLTGTNGAHVVSELSATSLYIGYADDGTPVAYRGNPLTIGVQLGFTSALVSALGGGIISASIRLSLYDGDSGIGDGALASGGGTGNDFDAYMDTFRVNGNAFGSTAGDFSAVTTQNTTSTGAVAAAGSGLGFRNDTLDTGFFVGSGSDLTNLYAALETGTLSFSLNDLSPNDNYFDFTQGIDASLINVGSAPVVTPPVVTPPVVTPPAGGPTAVPEPATFALLGAGLLGLGLIRRRAT